MLSKGLVFIAALVGMTGMAAAECPNACSNQGTCGAFDMCTCYRNFKGNDCSERVCPYAHAFVTSPQGDLNMDGDHYDNTGKFLVDDQTGQTLLASIPVNSKTLTFSTTADAYGNTANIGDITTYELNVGDAIKIADEWVFEGAEVEGRAAVKGRRQESESSRTSFSLLSSLLFLQPSIFERNTGLSSSAPSRPLALCMSSTTRGSLLSPTSP